MDDLTGRNQLTQNVIVSWIMQGFVIIAGFVVPRQISDSLGSSSLGVWDLGWATVRYMSLTSMGVGASLSRYIALYRGQNDDIAMSKATTSVFTWQLVIAFIVLVLSAISAYGLTLWIELPSASNKSEAQWVLFLLGSSLAIKMLATPAGGIISGCHRWDYQHSINAMQDFFLALMMVALLVLGGGLIELAFIVVAAAIATAVVRYIIAMRLCPTIKIHPRYWERKMAFKMLSFGGKSMIANSSQVLIFQTIAILLAGFGTPAILAIFSRGVALIRIQAQIVKKVSSMFIPMTSGLIGVGRKDEATAFLIRAGCYSMSITIPLSFGLAAYSDFLLAIWMGESYSNNVMMMILIAGTALPIAQSGTISVLAGLNSHGRVGIATLIAVSTSIAISIPIVSYHGWTVVSAAIMLGFSWTAGQGIVIPIYLKRAFNIEYKHYITETIFRPLVYNIPMALFLWLSREAHLNEQWFMTICFFILAISSTIIIYWKWLFSRNARSTISSKFMRHTR